MIGSSAVVILRPVLSLDRPYGVAKLVVVEDSDLTHLGKVFVALCLLCWAIDRGITKCFLF